MHIVDAIRALKGDSEKLRQALENEKGAHGTTTELLQMAEAERDEAREALQPTKDATGARAGSTQGYPV